MGCLAPPGLGLTRVEAQQVPPGPLHRAAHTDMPRQGDVFGGLSALRGDGRQAREVWVPGEFHLT